MNQLPATLEAISPDHLANVTGAGIGSQIGGLFGAKGAQWGGIADSILGMFNGGAASGGASAAASGGASASASADAG